MVSDTRPEHNLQRLKRGVALLGFDAIGQRNRTIKASVTPLGAIVALLLILDVAVPLAADDEHILIDLDVDVVPAQARKISADDKVAAALEDFDLRRPQAAQSRLLEILATGALETLLAA